MSIRTTKAIIAEMRLRHGMSNQQIADAFGVNKGWITHVMNGIQPKRKALRAKFPGLDERANYITLRSEIANHSREILERLNKVTA